MIARIYLGDLESFTTVNGVKSKNSACIIFGKLFKTLRS